MLEIEATYFRTSPDSSTFEDDALAIVSCYQQVFGTDPAWNEGVLCLVCSRPGAPRKWNLHGAPSSCPACQTKLEPCWPTATVLADMRSEFKRPDAVCAVLRQGDTVLGACWGFSASAEELEIHLNEGLPAVTRAPDVAPNLRRMFPEAVRFAYQDEIFLLPEFQGQGLGRRLFKLRHTAFAERGLTAYVMRTKRHPPSKSYLWFHDRWGYRPVSEYPDADERVILAHSLAAVSLRL